MRSGLSYDLLRDVETALAEPRFFGMSVGPTVNDLVVIEFLGGLGKWGLVAWCLDLLRVARLRRRRQKVMGESAAAARGRVLVTWRLSSARIDGLMRPLIGPLGPDSCAVLYERDPVLPLIPPDVAAIRWGDAIGFDPVGWQAEFRRCWPVWKEGLGGVARRQGLPTGSLDRFRVQLLSATQALQGCRDFLAAHRPRAIVTEHDRASFGACIVLAARQAGIPSFTMQHGVLNDDCLGYVPLVADRMFCWGEFHRAKLLVAGEAAERLLVGGCPRLRRELSATREEGRRKLGLTPGRPVVMLASGPCAAEDWERITAIFCEGAERLGEVSSVVRLHPAERLCNCEDAVRRWPWAHFVENGAATLDEALAAADVLAVHSSGLGSDALVKGRDVVVIDIPPALLGHGRDLVERAGCPRVTSAEEFAGVVGRLLTDDAYRRERRAAAGRFVEEFCTAFGEDAARRIADAIVETVSDNTTRHVVGETA